MSLTEDFNRFVKILLSKLVISFLEQMHQLVRSFRESLIFWIRFLNVQYGNIKNNAGIRRNRGYVFSVVIGILGWYFNLKNLTLFTLLEGQFQPFNEPSPSKNILDDILLAGNNNFSAIKQPSTDNAGNQITGLGTGTFALSVNPFGDLVLDQVNFLANGFWLKIALKPGLKIATEHVYTFSETNCFLCYKKREL